MAKKVLIVGSHRSGSTWIGKILAASPVCYYTHEPFNIIRHPDTQPFAHWFDTFDPRNPSHLAHIENTFLKLQGSLNFRYKNAIKRLMPYHVVKDPLALLSTHTLYEKYFNYCIVVVRHPAAFVVSLIKAGWVFPFEHIENKLFLFGDKCIDQESFDRIVQGGNEITKNALLWRLLHSYILRLPRNNRIIRIRYEDIYENPLRGFRYLCNRTGFPFSRSHIAAINRYSTKAGKGHRNFDYLRRSPDTLKETWKTALSNSAIDQIRTLVEPVARHYYHSQDWETNS